MTSSSAAAAKPSAASAQPALAEMAATASPVAETVPAAAELAKEEIVASPSPEPVPAAVEPETPAAAVVEEAAKESVEAEPSPAAEVVETAAAEPEAAAVVEEAAKEGVEAESAPAAEVAETAATEPEATPAVVEEAAKESAEAEPFPAAEVVETAAAEPEAAAVVEEAAKEGVEAESAPAAEVAPEASTVAVVVEEAAQESVEAEPAAAAEPEAPAVAEVVEKAPRARGRAKSAAAAEAARSPEDELAALAAAILEEVTKESWEKETAQDGAGTAEIALGASAAAGSGRGLSPIFSTTPGDPGRPYAGPFGGGPANALVRVAPDFGRDAEPAMGRISQAVAVARSRCSCPRGSARFLFRLTSVPVVAAHPDPAGFLVAMTDEHGLGAEKFRVLGTRLSNPKLNPRPKVIQVTSSIVGEGKTLVSCNLAVTLARRSGSKVLLLEGDLRKPAACQMFGLSSLEGIGEWWSQEQEGASIVPFLRRVEDSSLCLLPAGEVKHPVAVLQSGRMATLIKQLARWFDWVIVDSPPVLPMADANLWSRLADGTVFVIREGVVQRPSLQAALDSLDSPKLLGTVLNDAADFDRLDRYGYGRYYYSSQRPGDKEKEKEKEKDKDKEKDKQEKDKGKAEETDKRSRGNKSAEGNNDKDAEAKLLKKMMKKKNGEKK